MTDDLPAAPPYRLRAVPEEQWRAESGNRCECRGQCGVRHPGGRCDAEQRCMHPINGTITTLQLQAIIDPVTRGKVYVVLCNLCRNRLSPRPRSSRGPTPDGWADDLFDAANRREDK